MKFTKTHAQHCHFDVAKLQKQGEQNTAILAGKSHENEASNTAIF